MLRLAVLLLALALTGCRTLTPPPSVPRHASPAPMPEGTLSLSLVLGAAMSGFLDIGLGAEVRAAMQVSPEVETGVGLGFGRADPGVDRDGYVMNPKVYMVSLRAYTSITPLDTERVAFTTGVGVGVMSIGLVSLTVDASATAGYTNSDFIPYGTLGAALAIPARKGHPYGSSPAQPNTGIYGFGLVGFGVPTGDHFLSLELGYARDVRSGELSVLSTSLGERWSN